MKECRRFIYKNPPLVEVIYQLRFPTILSINAKDPIEFQDAIRLDYPIYLPTIEQSQQMVVNANGLNVIPSIVQKGSNKNYAFVSADGKWKINLASSFISISTLSYTCWEDLKTHFKRPKEKFIDIYKPAFFERVGLRYVNAITKSKLKILDKKWSELIQPHLLGCMAIEDESKFKTYSMDSEYSLDVPNSFVHVHSGLGNINGMTELSFLLDNDYFKLGMTKLEDSENVAESLHKNSTKFIRNAIKDDLHIAMGPQELQEEPNLL